MPWAFSIEAPEAIRLIAQFSCAHTFTNFVQTVVRRIEQMQSLRSQPPLGADKPRSRTC